VLLQIRRHTSHGNAVNARMSSRASSRWAAAAGQLGLQHGDDLGVLGADRGASSTTSARYRCCYQGTRTWAASRCIHPLDHCVHI
jgi:hypothetical protein